MESYEKLREIGKGSYGVVWLVKHKKDRKSYVLKKIDLRRSSERDKLSAQQEAQLLKTLKHPNIVSYKESFHTDGYLHIVMLFCEGGDLYTKIKEQNGKFIEESQIVEWFVQIAMALQYLHEKNILHRDLKTQNIFLTRNKIIKVGDLGIARVLKSNNDMATTIIGTPYYMSPELFSNKPYNSKSDVWALGCVVYEMTTLKHAFNAKDMSSLVFKITRGKMPAIPSHYSKEFMNLIESMLNLDPKKRPTASKILRDPFIKKNILLFLERTKQKQQLLIDNDAKNGGGDGSSSNQVARVDKTPVRKPLDRPMSTPESNIMRNSPTPGMINLNKNPKPVASEFDEPTEFVNLSKLKQNQEKPMNRPLHHEHSESEPDFRLRRNQQVNENDQAQSQPSTPVVGPRNVASALSYDPPNRVDTEDQPTPALPVKNRVRISSFVENIEYNDYSINSSRNDGYADNPNDETGDYDNDFDDDDEEKPKYELTRPIKLSPGVAQAARNELRDNSPNMVHQPKIVDRRSNEANPKPTDPIQSKLPISDSQSLNLDARERRRQRLRLSQNEPNSSESRPPVLRRYAGVKSNKSDDGKNNDKSSNRSYNDEKSGNKDRLPFEDSMKIIKKNNNMHNNSGVEASSNRGNKRYDSKLSNANSDSSSSSSSLASSDDNDPGNQLVRIEKLKKKEKREIGNLIDRLNCTLLEANNVSKIETDVEDIKDEVFDDLEEEVLLAEKNMQNNSPPIVKSNQPVAHRESNKTSGYNSYNGSKDLHNDDNDDDDIHVWKASSPSPAQRPKSRGEESNNYDNLGATNHMQSRINSLEEECLKAIGRTKLEEVYKILDSYTESEAEKRLINLIGSHVYNEFHGKLWLLKFCKETAKISYR